MVTTCHDYRQAPLYLYNFISDALDNFLRTEQQLGGAEHLEEVREVSHGLPRGQSTRPQIVAIQLLASSSDAMKHVTYENVPYL